MRINNTAAFVLIGIAISISCTNAHAGNPARAGEEGATELLIDPWAGTSGFAGANTSCVQGIESQFLNVAGTAFTDHTQVIIGNTDYLSGGGGGGMNIAVAGLCQRVGATGAIGISIMSMNFGSIPITTYDNPDGGIGYYNPQFINIGLSYAKQFSDNISGGVNIKLVSESISNVSATDVAVDAGIQYVRDVAHGHKNLHFGISLKNVGPQMQYSGDGMSQQVTQYNSVATGQTGQMTVHTPAQAYELPSLINIGAAYDFRILKDTGGRSAHRITVAANFTSNAFEQDDEMLGVEYAFKSYFSVRVGYEYQNGITSPLSTDPTSGGRLTVFTGPCAGVTLQYPFGKNKTSTFGVSYCYRATNPFQGCNTIAIALSL